MDPQSPPKRMTRARAAAKATETTTKTTRIVTAAAKARTAPKSTPTTTASKRKTRADDADDEDELDMDTEPQQPLPTMRAARTTASTRAKAKKTAEPAIEEAPAPSKPTRGRPKKAVESAKDEQPRPASRATRTKKTQEEEEQEEMPAEPVKRTARGRAASTVTKPAGRTAVKKTVKFEEPEKENIAPAVASKVKAPAKTTEATPGLRAKPVRRAAAATGRTTRATRSAATTEEVASKPKPKPLSPKKVTQVSANNNVDSEDELAGPEHTPIKPLSRSPVKASTSVARPPDLQPLSKDVEMDLGPSEPIPSVILGSPARRQPPSPWKDSMKSPARRVEIPVLSQTGSQHSQQSGQTTTKVSLLQSPAKRPQSPIKSLQLPTAGPTGGSTSPFKVSLLASPAKRPASSMKAFLSPQKAEESVDTRTPAPKPTLLTTPVAEEAAHEIFEDDGVADGLDEGVTTQSPTRLRFPGRLSAVLPRHADPALKDTTLAVALEAEEIEIDLVGTTEDTANSEDIDENMGDPMIIDEPTMEIEASPSRQAESFRSRTRLTGTSFGLRQKDLQSHEADSESEDELTRQTFVKGRIPSPFDAVPATPCPAGSVRTPKSQAAQKSTRSTGRSTVKRPRTDDKFGFTPLAEQLSGWVAGASPLKSGISSESPESGANRTAAPAEEPRLSPAIHETPARDTFFDDEMSVRNGPTATEQIEAAIEADVEAALVAELAEPEFNDIPVTDEDVALAAEAHEMSLMEPEQIDDLLNPDGTDDSLSETSQEYADENAVPIDPALLQSGEPGVPPVTPQRMIRKEFHTVSKVPLKPADESTPRPKSRRRGHSASRLPVSRPSYSLTRNATVISYSPTKNREEHLEDENHREHRAGSEPPHTPRMSDAAAWSTAGTPARTPRRDVNPAMLRGAVVFVDVHTSEGADASGIFVELLTQMGARCVKSWPWNPTSPPGKDGVATSSKVGITHVVYKDGGKRTLEKVRESGGVVQCVGVSWVLDCERENEWLDEAPYYIDTSMVPRGGARRRKSMEPKALANLNGMLVPTPSRGASAPPPARESQSMPATPVNRRDSGLWMRTPEDQQQDGPENELLDGEFPYDLDEDEDGEMGWGDENSFLMPVPKTPAPEAIARFAADITPATPSGASDYGDDASVLAAREALMTRTCPPNKSTSQYAELGSGVLGQEKDEQVLLRLMAARRKSLQFAPKVGSPLSKTWN